MARMADLFYKHRLMTMTNEDIEIVRGDTEPIEVLVKDGGGSVVDLTDYTARLTVKRDPEDPDTDALLQTTGTISAPMTGICNFNLTSAQTTIPAGKYYYDIQISKTGSVKTVAYGMFVVEADITRTT